MAGVPEVFQSRRTKKWIETPSGWARINVAYDQHRYAEPGSLLEFCYLSLFEYRQCAEAYRTIVLAAASTGQSFNQQLQDYLGYLFPYQRKSTQDFAKKQLEVLEKMSNRVIQFQPSAATQESSVMGINADERKTDPLEKYRKVIRNVDKKVNTRNRSGNLVRGVPSGSFNPGTGPVRPVNSSLPNPTGVRSPGRDSGPRR